MSMSRLSASANRKVADFVTQLPSELERPWSPEMLSACADVSPAELHRAFVELTGDSPMRWVERLRLMTASALLVGSSLPVKDVGVAVGFLDFGDFVRGFQQQFGESPAAYRRSRCAPGDFVEEPEYARTKRLRLEIEERASRRHRPRFRSGFSRA